MTPTRITTGIFRCAFATLLLQWAAPGFAYPLYTEGKSALQVSPAPHEKIPEPGLEAAAANVSPKDPLALLPRPADKPESALSARNMFNLAFQEGDAVSISSDKGLEDCRKLNTMKAQYSELARNIDGNCVRGLNGASVNLATHDFVKAAQTRVSFRAMNKFATTNPFLKTLAEGKLNLDISFTEMFSDKKPVEELRPQYVLQVTDRKPDLPGGGILAAIVQPALPDAAGVDGHAGDNRRIVEYWPVLEPAADAGAEQKAPSISRGQYFAKRIGISEAPGSHFRLKVERDSSGMTTRSIHLRLEESNNLLFADVTSLMHGDPHGVAFGMRAPYWRHAVGCEYSSMDVRPVYYYRYWFSGETNTTVSYNAESRFYSTGVAVGF